MEAQPKIARRSGACGGGDGLPRRVLDQRVSAGQRALGIVRGEGERELFELPPAFGLSRPGGARRAAPEHEEVHAGEGTSFLDAALGAGAELAQLLVEMAVVAGDVLSRRPGHVAERAGTVENRPAAMAMEPAPAGGELRPRLAAVDRDGGFGGVCRSRAADGGHVVDQRSVGVVAH